MAVTGLVLPFVFFLNKRFGGTSPNQTPGFLLTLRQAMWVGLWMAICTWLQMNRAFGLAIAVLVGGFFILVEIWLQLRTQVSQVAH